LLDAKEGQTKALAEDAWVALQRDGFAPALQRRYLAQHCLDGRIVFKAGVAAGDQDRMGRHYAMGSKLSV